ncbi:type II secretion system F family protein [Achromobacter aloeverae]|uniref:Type II secretion system protein GspF domain-containing protein n=1 Tax=Achromobacter aloeverae TaxID=1750518 RepID=A0A4V1MSQ9_9BURK|nr:type II secretion system F family protein [Achromobacter aloeverae]RXN92900.1 hypothetical protein C7R54_03940 [Achromobacter aloeverae]
MIALAALAAAVCAGCLAWLLRDWLRPLLWPLWSPLGQGREGRPGLPPLWRAAWPWLDGIVRSGWLYLSWRRRGRLRRLLGRTGLERLLTPAHVTAVAYLCAAFVAVVALLLAACWLAPASRAQLAGASLGGAVLGALLPTHTLRARARTRARRMDKELPFLLDMATLCVEAGLNLQGALQRAVEHGPPGPLRDELQWALGDMRAGMARLDALRAWAVRTDLYGVRVLVTALAQADSLGMSLGPILRAQAEQRRAERIQHAERLAMRAPVKMLLPLLVCIFPCTFVVLGFPIVVQLRGALQ